MSHVEQQHGRLVEHKIVVKSWNTNPQRGFLRPLSKGEKSESSARVMQWLRGEPTDEREEDSEVVRSDVLPYEESVVDTDDPRHCNSDEEDAVETTCPRTVGQIKHAYRARARKEESAKDRRALDAARKQKERLKQYAPQVKSVVQAFDSRAPEPSSPITEQTTVSNTIQEQEVEDPDEFRLDASALVVHAAYRNSMLRVIRRHLSSGRNALLSVSLSSLDASVELSGIKLALQQLCSESLLFCVRDQNVLASVDHERGVVKLELLTRQPLQ